MPVKLPRSVRKWPISLLKWNEHCIASFLFCILHVLCCLLLTKVVEFAVIVLLVGNQTLYKWVQYWIIRLIEFNVLFCCEMGHITFCVLWIASVLFVSISGQNKLNDQCIVARTGSVGRCHYLENCSVVLKEINEHGLFPNFCTSQDRKQLVCCPLPPTKPTTSKPFTSSRISARSKFQLENR